MHIHLVVRIVGMYALSRGWVSTAVWKEAGKWEALNA